MIEAIRVQKFLSEQGVCSRRAAETAIRDGDVLINGDLAKIGDKIVVGSDVITFQGIRVKPKTRDKITIALNKPPGFICSNDDPHNERTVFELIPAEYTKSRLFCAGRLDKDSEGLLILTNNGELANRLMHPSSLVTKRYHVSLKQSFPRTKINLLLKGITFEGDRLKVEKAVFIGNRQKETGTEIDVAMHHGKKREIRRLFSALGYDVKRLKRYQIGKYSIKGIRKGAGILLRPNDISKLFKSDEEL